MSPTAKFAVKCGLFGVGTLLSGLVTAAEGGITPVEALAAVSGAWTVALGYAGIGAATTLEEPGK